MSERKRTSVNRLINRAVLLVGAGVLIVSLAILYFYLEEAGERKRQAVLTHARAMDANIRETLGYMTGMAQQIAATQEVRDLFEFGNLEEVEAWTLRTRRLLPHTIGLSLIDDSGAVVGNPSLQRIGPACRKDVHAFLKHEDVHYPLVHDENPELKHYDLVQPLLDGSANEAGLLLISFSLSALDQTIQNLVQQDYGYLLVAGDGKLIFEHGMDINYSYSVKRPLPGTDWMLEVYGDDRFDKDVLQTAAIAACIIFLALMLLALGVGWYLKKVITSDVRQLEQLLGFKSMRHAADWQSQPIRLKETAGLIKAIQSLSLEVSGSYERLASEAMTDALTGLGNRRSLELSEERYTRLAEEGLMVILMVMDIDHFKAINDEHGHKVGDQALEMLSTTLRANTRATDDIYRLGGDEVLVVFGMGKMEGLSQWFRRISDGFSDSLNRVTRQKIRATMTLSAGACVYEPGRDRDFKDALDRADKALYTAKSKGRDKLVVL